MKKNDLIDAIGRIDESHLEEVEQVRNDKKTIFPIVKILTPLAVVAGIFLYFAGSFTGNVNENGGLTDNMKSHVLAHAEYPELSKQPNAEDYVKGDSFDETKYNKDYDQWYENQEKIQPEQSAEVIYKGYKEFLKKANQTMLTKAEDKNFVYSPLNIYMATSMLAELADGNTEKQIFDLLNTSSIEEIRANAKDIWKDNYQDDGNSTSILSNSMWTKEGLQYNQDTLAELTKNYYASLYEGDFSSEDYNKALKDWMNKNTKNLLKDSVEGLKFKENTIMALISTIYFTDSWRDEFQAEFNTREIFKSTSGDKEVEFMNSTVTTMGYEGDSFIAADLNYANIGSMMFIKPKQSKGISDLIASKDLEKLLDNEFEYQNAKRLDVHFKVPKFDINSDIDMIESMKEMGVTDVFDGNKSDLSKLMQNANEMYVDQFLHSARVKIDEKGTESAAYTVVSIDEMAMIDELEEMDMKLDEPFMFTIRNRNGAIIFVGIVNDAL